MLRHPVVEAKRPTYSEAEQLTLGNVGVCENPGIEVRYLFHLKNLAKLSVLLRWLSLYVHFKGSPSIGESAGV